MAYESKVYIVNVVGEEDFKFAQTVAKFDLCNMGRDGFTDLFKQPCDFKIWVDESTETDTDKYGKKITAGDLQEVISFLENWSETKVYRRIPPFLAFLKALNPGEWDGLQIVHYGY